MESCWRCRIAMALYLKLFAILIVKQSDGRDLRPSEHGLAYQNASAKGDNSREMTSFFGGSLSSMTPSMPWQEARNMSNSSQWSDSGGGRDHVGQVLLVASLACGITGVALLAVALFVFLFPFQKKRSSSSPSPSAIPLPLPPPLGLPPPPIPLALPSTSDK